MVIHPAPVILNIGCDVRMTIRIAFLREKIIDFVNLATSDEERVYNFVYGDWQDDAFYEIFGSIQDDVCKICDKNNNGNCDSGETLLCPFADYMKMPLNKGAFVEIVTRSFEKLKERLLAG